jgi:hypothetical protein
MGPGLSIFRLLRSPIADPRDSVKKKHFQAPLKRLPPDFISLEPALAGCVKKISLPL